MAMYTWIAIQYTASPSLAVGCRISNRPPTTLQSTCLNTEPLYPSNSLCSLRNTGKLFFNKDRLTWESTIHEFCWKKTYHNPSSLSASALVLFGTSAEFVSELNPCPDHKNKKPDKCEIPELKFSCPWCLKCQTRHWADCLTLHT